MKSRTPILFLTIVFALVCLYHLSFTWKVNSINEEKIEYAETQLEINKNTDLSKITEESIANELRKEKINQEFINSLDRTDTTKQLVFELDSSVYYKFEDTLIEFELSTKQDTIRLNNSDIFSFNNIDYDSTIVDSLVKQEKDNIKNDYVSNKTLELSKLESYYIDSISVNQLTKETQGVYNLLFKNYTYQECLDKQINLGLDLKGGISVTLEVDIRDVLVNWAYEGSNRYEIFLSRLDLADMAMKSSSVDYLDLVKDEYGNELEARNDLSDIFGSEFKEVNGLTNEEVVKYLRKEIDGIISTTFTTLKERSERFANIRPNILTTSISGRFIVELPGAKDVKRVNSILTDPAKLEFWESYKLDEVFDITQSSIKFKGLSESDSIIMKEWLTTVNMFNQNGQFLFQPNDEGSFGPVIGYANSNSEEDLKELFNKLEKLFLNQNIKFAYGYLASDKTRKTLQVYALKTSPIYEDANEDGSVLNGDIISNSSASIQDGQWEVSMTMQPAAAQKWSKITLKNIDNHVAIVLDGTIRSCPVINTQIKGGSSVISGSFSSSEANDLANILGSGKLKSKLNILQQSVVGPSLGQASIDASMKSFMIALFIVFLYMIFYYYGAGIISNVALISNLFFIFGVLASTGMVLTLPGIAGIVLTIGMSVDANVLIYERIREELTNGKGVRLAIEDGYKSAYTSIIDANVTTLLTGIILYIFGSGPIKGFATTLIIGILTSLFCAIFITRLVISARLNKGKSISFSTRLTKGAFKNLNIDFIGKRRVFYVLSAIVILFGGYSLSTKGLDYGIDFSGGRTYIVNMPNETITNEDIKELLSKVFVNEDGSVQSIQVSKFNDLTEKDSLNQNNVAVDAVKITTKYMIDSDDKNADSIVTATLLNGLGSDFTDDNIVSYQKVASTIADDIRSSAWGSIIFSLLVIFLYILVRFKKWQFSLGAVIAVFHDVLIVLSVFSILYGILPFSLEIDQAFIAAILTIIGYSLNDTVVVFDRVREYMINYKKKEVHEFINQSLNSTLSRTINTSLTTFFVLLVIFLFGGEVIKGFMFALMVGVIVGTYSSLFVASPIMVDTIKRKEIKNK
ncbi:MAG: protein translocase subunit SecD [Flavobacteriales bacterium]|nr:protein translocase subunit SecD [Flavobacteriales bacterium]MDG2058851.1 protein translocase subunit SecD [Flavobacteriales bacterium]